MTNRLLFAMAILTVLATQVVSRPRPPLRVQTPGGTIRGRVLQNGTSAPISDVQITVTRSGVGLRGAQSPEALQAQVDAARARGVAIPPAIQAALEAARGGQPLQWSATTDRDGRFVVANVQAGSYNVRAEREGYFGPDTPNAAPAFVSSNVVVADGQQSPELLFSLTPGSVIDGRVLDFQGRAIVNVSVQAFRLAYQNGNPTLQQAAAATTDDRGEYRLFRIPPGEYYVGVNPSQSGARGFGGGRGARGAAEAGPERLVQTFHPDAFEIQTARSLILAGGVELTAIDINVRTASTITVSGQVTSAVRLPARVSARGVALTPAVQLTLVPRNSNAVPILNSGTIATVSLDSPANGQFEIPGVLPGSYDLFARVINPPDPAAPAQVTQPTAYFGRVSFEAGYQHVQGLSIVIRPGVSLSGYATVDGNRAAAAGAVRVVVEPADSSRLVTGYQRGGQGQLLAGQDGSISFPFLNEGLLRIRASLAPVAAAQRGAGSNLLNAYVEDIREGGVSIYDDGLRVGTEPPRPIEVFVKTDGGTINGIVTDAQQNPKPGTIVTLVPPERRRQNPDLYKIVTSAAQGRFTIIGVAPGSYKLFAWESVAQGAYQNSAFLARYENRGYPVVVAPASTTNVQITAIPASRP